MTPKVQKHLLSVCLLFFLSFYSASASEYVPLLLWSNINDLSCPTKPQGPGETISSIFTDDYVKCLANGNPDQVFVFVYDKFSVGDISTYGQTQDSSNAFHNIRKYTSEFPSRIISSVQPSGILEDLFSRLLHVTEKANIKVIHFPSFDRSTHSATEMGLRQYDEEIRDTISNIKGKYVVIVTSEDTPDDHKNTIFGEGHRRQLLGTATENKTFQYLIGECIYMSFTSVTLTVVKPSDKEDDFSSLVLKSPSRGFKEQCLDNESAVDTGNVSMTMDFVGDENGSFADVSIEMMFKKAFYPVSAMSWWTVFDITVTYTLNNDTTSSGDTVTRQLNQRTFVDTIAAPLGRSYACASSEGMSYVDYVAKSPNATVLLHFDDWQVQPFGVNTTNVTFSQAVDCVGWYTEPILSGLFVSLLLLLVLAYGICMASTVTTMDRFDNPKGKTLAVQQDGN